MQNLVIGGRGHVTYFRILGPPRISGTAKARESCACSVRGAFDAAFAKLLWPLVVVVLVLDLLRPYRSYGYAPCKTTWKKASVNGWSLKKYYFNTVTLCCIECMRCKLLLLMCSVSVCQSVCVSVTRINSAFLCKNGWTDQDAVWSEHSCGHGILCYTRVLIPSQTGVGELGKISPIMHPLHISGTTEAWDLKFCVHIEGWGPKEKTAKVGQESCDLLLNFGTPSYLRKG